MSLAEARLRQFLALGVSSMPLLSRNALRFELVLATCLSWMVMACSSPNDEMASRLAYSYLNPEQSVLLKMREGDTLSLCGSSPGLFTKVSNAIEKWLTFVNRQNSFKYENSCSGRSVIKIAAVSNAQICAQVGMASNCSVLGVAGGPYLTVVSGTPEYITVHEVGHLFGINHSEYSNAVMAAYPQTGQFHADDIAAIRSLVSTKRTPSDSSSRPSNNIEKGSCETLDGEVAEHGSIWDTNETGESHQCVNGQWREKSAGTSCTTLDGEEARDGSIWDIDETGESHQCVRGEWVQVN